MSNITLYGIANCNTVKKAREYLKENNVEYEFIDFKKQPPTDKLLKKWCKKFGWDKAINRAGMTYRKLTDEQKAAINDDNSATEIALEKPSIIKRPITEIDGKPVLLGFKEAEYAELF